MVATAVISGLAAAVFAIPYVREILLILSLAYMLYLAAKVAFAGSKIGFIEATEAPQFKDGIALQAINPKAYVANTVLFSGFSFMPEHLVSEVAIKLAIWTAIWIPIHFAWLMVGITLRRMNLPETAQRAINIFMAISMLIVVGLAILNG